MVKRYTYWVLQNLTSDNKSWKVPVMITPYLKHEIIFGLNFIKTSNAITNFVDNDVNFGTEKLHNITINTNTSLILTT